VLGGGGGPLLTATQYEPLYASAAETTEALAQQRMPIAGSLADLRIRVTPAPTGSMTFTIRKNGADTVVVCTTPAGSATCSSPAGASATFAAADLIAVRSSGTTTGNPRMAWTATFTLP
jgi:hypothetical protein